MRWPLGWLRLSSGQESRPAPPARGSGWEWSALPPIQRAARDLELTAEPVGFVRGLAASNPPDLALQPLGHERGLGAPAGLVGGLATPVPAGRGHEKLSLRPSPGRFRLRWPERAASALLGPGPELEPPAPAAVPEPAHAEAPPAVPAQRAVSVAPEERASARPGALIAASDPAALPGLPEVSSRAVTKAATEPAATDPAAADPAASGPVPAQPADPGSAVAGGSRPWIQRVRVREATAPQPAPAPTRPGTEPAQRRLGLGPPLPRTIQRVEASSSGAGREVGGAPSSAGTAPSPAGGTAGRSEGTSPAFEPPAPRGTQPDAPGAVEEASGDAPRVSAPLLDVPPMVLRARVIAPPPVPPGATTPGTASEVRAAPTVAPGPATPGIAPEVPAASQAGPSGTAPRPEPPPVPPPSAQRMIASKPPPPAAVDTPSLTLPARGTDEYGAVAGAGAAPHPKRGTPRPSSKAAAQGSPALVSQRPSGYSTAPPGAPRFSPAVASGQAITAPSVQRRFELEEQRGPLGLSEAQAPVQPRLPASPPLTLAPSLVAAFPSGRPPPVQTALVPPSHEPRAGRLPLSPGSAPAASRAGWGAAPAAVQALQEAAGGQAGLVWTAPWHPPDLEPPPQAASPDLPAPPLSAQALSVQRQAESEPAPAAPASPAAGGGGAVHSEQELDELARKLYDRFRSRIRGELLVDRERAGLVTDLR